jgi:hypothetical protein
MDSAKIANNLFEDSGSSQMRPGCDACRWRGTMLTAGVNALALMRFGVIRLAHGGGRDGFAWLLMGLAAIGVAVWAVARGERTEPAKN